MSREQSVGSASDAGTGSGLPAGTVTFLLSDIEGSTRLWSQFPEGMERAVAESYAILDRAIATHDGVRPVEQGEGDSVVGAFSRASDAVAAALRAQLDLRVQEWPHGLDLRVRIALHTADAQLRGDDNYFGLALSRCARLRAIAHGGQTLLSRTTRDLVVDALPDGVGLVDCGLHRLRDLARPEHVFALAHPDLGDAPEVVRSLDSFPNNLPDHLTSFVGRARELSQVRDALGDTRMLTLTGAGGAGKTRLALQVAADALDRFPDGAWWLDLAPVADPVLVGEVLAGALGVRPLPGMTALEAACARLATSRALVVLDNCEHLLAACAEASETLLHACPDVAVVATSRAPLGAAGETDWRVPSLSLPAPGCEPEPLELAEHSDAVRLFIERAQKARPGFVVTSDNAPAVAQICHELDGLPLAIELAAARVRMMSAEQIAAGLDDRFHLLTGGGRSALPRQQTLRASVDWSHDLLSDPERALLRRLAVFAGGFTLNLAEAVCSDLTLERVAILDVLGSLVDQSLVVADERAGAVRYRLLETVRQYALEHLAAAGEDSQMRDRHRVAMLELAERIAPELHRPGQENWLEVLDQDTANFTAAFDWAAYTDPECALRLCVALTFWWKGRGLYDPAERAFGRSLSADDGTPSSLRAHTLWGRGYLAAFAGQIETSVLNLQQAREMAEEIGDPSALARSLMGLGFIQVYPDPFGSRSVSQRANDLARDCGDDFALVASYLNLAWSHVFRHELDDAERLLDESLPIAERHGYPELQAYHWIGKGWRPWASSDSPRACELAQRARAFAQAAREPTSEATAQALLAHLEIAAGEPGAALARMQATYIRTHAQGAGFAMGIAANWRALAQVALGQSADARASLEEAIATGMDWGFILANAICTLSEILRLGGELDPAETRARQALEIGERMNSPIVIASVREALARIHIERAEWAQSEALLHEALALRVDHNLLLWMPETIDGLAETAAGLDSHQEAARIIGIADRARNDLGHIRTAPRADRAARLEEAIRVVLGDDAYRDALREGRELALQDAVTWIRGARGARKRPPSGWESLTPTELRVVALVAQGLTNPQIGERMFISRGTVKTHLSHIFAKLDIASRAELATEATRQAAS